MGWDPVGDAKKAAKKAAAVVNNVGKVVSKGATDTLNTAKKAADDTKKTVNKGINDSGRAIGDAATDTYRYGVKPLANAGALAATGGAWGTDGKSGYTQGNSIAGAAMKTLGIEDGMRMGASALSGKRADGMGMETAEGDIAEATEPNAEANKPVVDPYLEEELANARRRSKASTILAGSSDSVGTTSAKRTLLGI